MIFVGFLPKPLVSTCVFLFLKNSHINNEFLGIIKVDRPIWKRVGVSGSPVCQEAVNLP